MRYIFTLTFLIIVVQLGNTQYFKGGESFNQLVKKAKLAYENGDQLYALEYARRAARIDTTRLDLWYMAGEMARELTIIDEAREAYVMAAKHENRADYPLIDFNRGNVLKMFGEYDEAKQSYQRFLREYSGSDKVDPSLILKTKRYIQQCVEAPLLNDEVVTNVKRVDIKQNAPCRTTFAPYLADNELHYTSLFYPKDVDTTDLANAKFNIFRQDLTRRRNLEAIGDDAGRSGHFALSIDKQKMYYTVCEYQKSGKYRCEIYRSQRNPSGTWAEGERLPKTINGLAYTSTQPAIGLDADGNEVLFFASNRPQADGTTDMDIWQSQISIQGDGSLAYGNAENLTAINTTGDEVTPFYHAKCQTLYFSTNGRASLGELDIYQVQREGSTWGKPKTMGYPVNSSFNDNYFFRTEDGGKAYFASNRVTSEDLEMQDCKGCCPKIYEAPIITPVSLEMIAFCGTEPLNDFTYSMNAGDLRVKGEAYETPIELQPNTSYELELQKEGYTSTSFEFITEGFCDSTVLQQRVYMQPQNNLTVSVFGQGRTGTKSITLLDKVSFISRDDRTFETKENVAVEDLKFTIKPNVSYILVAEKEGYRKDSVEVAAVDISALCLLETGITLKEDENLPVVPKITGESKIPELERLIGITLPLPATLYFHNAIPAIESSRNLGDVDVSYQTTYENYVEIIDLYRNELRDYYQRKGDARKAGNAPSTIDNFFTNKVQRGYETLKLYASALELYMADGKNAQICIQGMASPLASPAYNQYLSERRINSVRNFLREYKGGILAPHIGTRLTIKELPLGEATGTAEMEERIFGIYAPESAILRNVTIIDIQAQGAEGCEPISN